MFRYATVSMIWNIQRRGCMQSQNLIIYKRVRETMPNPVFILMTNARLTFLLFDKPPPPRGSIPRKAGMSVYMDKEKKGSKSQSRFLVVDKRGRCNCGLRWWWGR